MTPTRRTAGDSGTGPSPPAATAASPAAPIGVRGVLLGLTMGTGLVDAVCYLGMGHVFVANMTGNVVLLGFAIAGARGFSVAASLVALGTFLVGAAAGGRLGVALSASRRWLVAASGIQMVLAAAAAVAAASGGLGPTGDGRFGILGLLGVGMGLQNATVRRLAVPDITTTVLTLTLTGLAADSSLAGGDNPRPLRRLASVAAMLGGALAGGALMVDEGFTTTLAVLAGFFALVTAGFAVATRRSPQRDTTRPAGSP